MLPSKPLVVDKTQASPYRVLSSDFQVHEQEPQHTDVEKTSSDVGSPTTNEGTVGNRIRCAMPSKSSLARQSSKLVLPQQRPRGPNSIAGTFRAAREDASHLRSTLLDTSPSSETQYAIERGRVWRLRYGQGRPSSCFLRSRLRCRDGARPWYKRQIPHGQA